MCVLSNVDILREVCEGDLKISNFNAKNIKSNGYDWRLGPVILTADRYTINRWHRKVLDVGDTFEFLPGEFYLCSTIERLEQPRHIMSMMTGRSSLGRLGWVCHMTAAHFDAGFHGHGTAEVKVFGAWPVPLRIGQRVGQFIFEYLRTPTTMPYNAVRTSKYVDQPGEPIPSRLEWDQD